MRDVCSKQNKKTKPQKKDNEMKISNLPIKDIKSNSQENSKSKNISRKGIYTYVVKIVINHL